MPSWRHYSIAQRVEFLEKAFTDVNVLEAFRRAVRGVKVGLVVAALASGAIVFRNVGTEVKRGAIIIEMADAVEAGDLSRAERAIARGLEDPDVATGVEETVEIFGRTEEGRALGPIFVALVLEKSRSALAEGDFAGAVRRFQKALKHRALWSEENAVEADRLRRRLRRVRDGDEEP